MWIKPKTNERAKEKKIRCLKWHSNFEWHITIPQHAVASIKNDHFCMFFVVVVVIINFISMDGPYLFVCLFFSLWFLDGYHLIIFRLVLFSPHTFTRLLFFLSFFCIHILRFCIIVVIIITNIISNLFSFGLFVVRSTYLFCINVYERFGSVIIIIFFLLFWWGKSNLRIDVSLDRPTDHLTCYILCSSLHSLHEQQQPQPACCGW